MTIYEKNMAGKTGKKLDPRKTITTQTSQEKLKNSRETGRNKTQEKVKGKKMTMYEKKMAGKIRKKKYTITKTSQGKQY